MIKLPLLIFDGECKFCNIWISYWHRLTGNKLNYAPYQKVANDFPQISKKEFSKSLKYISPDRQIFSGAQATYKTLEISGKWWWMFLYTHFPPFALVSEFLYKIISHNRSFFYYLTVLFWGKEIYIETFKFNHWLFLRFLGLIYFIAILSFFIQIPGLIGEGGILPVRNYLNLVSQQYGIEKFYLAPTLSWIDTSDYFLRFLAILGMGCAILLLINKLIKFSLIALWLIYLSFVVAGQTFMSFQWDILLLEVGFLSIFYTKNSPFIRLLIVFVLFKVMFYSGVVKLTSGDPNWRNLTALEYHYLTQPLPTPLAWYVYQLPGWFHKLSTGLMLVVELMLPLLYFAPKRARIFVAIITVMFQSIVALTGNYTFFNFLVIILCLLLIDDKTFKMFIPNRIWIFIKQPSPGHSKSLLIQSLTILVLAVVIIVNTLQTIAIFYGRRTVPQPLMGIIRLLSPFYIVNRYGLFAVMTTQRGEIIIQGSQDKTTWLDYKFKHKPQEVNKPPTIVAPYQPRLDWQMWFAALGSYNQNPWFTNLMIRLLQGFPDVISLLQYNPFPNQPPKYIRAIYYTYQFSNFEEKQNNNQWWTRQYQGIYFPEISLDDIK